MDARLKSAALQRNHTPGEPLLGAGTTPLMRAARNGDYAAMRVLLAAGADASLKQPSGTTVLMLASGVGRGLGVFAKDYGTEADLLRPWSCSSRGTWTSTRQPTGSPRFIWRRRRDSTRW